MRQSYLVTNSQSPGLYPTASHYFTGFEHLAAGARNLLSVSELSLGPTVRDY